MHFGEGYNYSPYVPLSKENGNGSYNGFDSILERINELPEEDARVIFEELSTRFKNSTSIPENYHTEFRAKEALDVIDRIITDVYLPFRGAESYKTERAIFVEDPHVPHRENDAEHSWHIAFTLQVFWDNKNKLGIKFPPNFDMQKALQYALKHDIIEIWADDVDATTKDTSLLLQKKERELAAHRLIKKEYPYLNGIADIWEKYEAKADFEAKIVKDLDAIAATRVICLDGGKKWHHWDNSPTTREYMCEVFRKKLQTPYGHALWDELEKDLDNHPEYFPENNNSNDYQYYPIHDEDQGKLF